MNIKKVYMSHKFQIKPRWEQNSWSNTYVLPLEGKIIKQWVIFQIERYEKAGDG